MAQGGVSFTAQWFSGLLGAARLSNCCEQEPMCKHRRAQKALCSRSEREIPKAWHEAGVDHYHTHPRRGGPPHVHGVRSEARLGATWVRVLRSCLIVELVNDSLTGLRLGPASRQSWPHVQCHYDADLH